MSTQGPAQTAFAVQILVAKGKTLTLKGSGTVIGERAVLTARHVIDSVPPNELRVRLERTGQVVRVTACLPQPAVTDDLQVLQVDEVLKAPHASLFPRAIPHGESVLMEGYPKVTEEAPSATVEKVTGTTVAPEAGANTLAIDINVLPDEWPGMSGAAVRLSNSPVVVGVVRSWDKGWQRRRILATPVGRFRSEPWFQQALGWGAVHQEFEAETKQLRSTLTDLLADDVASTLCKILKTELSLATADAEPLADALLNSDALTVARALNRASQRATSAIGCEVMHLLLPYLVDWRDTLTRARQQRNQNKTTFELSYRTHAIAEVLMAGIDGRPCDFIPAQDSRKLVGAGMVDWPASDLAPVLRDEATLRAGVVQVLAGQLGISKRGSPEAWQEDLRSELVFLQEDEDPPRYHYLLVIDDELSAQSPNELKDWEHPLAVADGRAHAWQIIQKAVGSCLPQLRLVRLTGAPRDNPNERRLVLNIHKLQHRLEKIAP